MLSFEILREISFNKSSLELVFSGLEKIVFASIFKTEISIANESKEGVVSLRSICQIYPLDLSIFSANSSCV